jgi:hypothetical protein
MANMQFRIVRERDNSYTVEIAQGETLRHVERGFRTSDEALVYAEGRQAASMGMDNWERMPDGERH